MQTKHLSVDENLSVVVWEYSDAFPPDQTYLGEFQHEDALDPFGPVLFPKLQEHILKTLRERVEDPSTVNMATVNIVQGYGSRNQDAVQEPVEEVQEVEVEPQDPVEPTEEDLDK